MTALFINLILVLALSTCSHGYVFTDGCHPLCYCDFTALNLTIKCNSQLLNTISLPDVNSYPFLRGLQYLIMRDSFLRDYPQNLCQYSSTLKYIDLTNNLISENLTNTRFNCLNNLDYLSLSNNLIINIEENAFDNLNNVRFMDLSYNKIKTIPFNLFYFKLPSLNTLILKYNFITELDIWMLFLRNIIYIDLTFNQITKFTNQIKWNPYLVSPNTKLMDANLVDLRYNNITNFDDNLLRLYSVCTITEFAQFIYLFNRILFSNNPIVCNCQASYNLLNFYQTYISNNAVSPGTTIFLAKCASPGEYTGLGVFTFTNPNVCANTSVSFAGGNCGIMSTTTLSTVAGSFIPQNLINKPNTTVNETIPVGSYDSQIAGIVIGFSGVLVIFLILLYCICPIEILAVCFNSIPYFYYICPCKSGVQREKFKDYDLFISYNKTNENWVRNRLVPFIHEKNLVEKYKLQYDSENKMGEVFGPYIRHIMEKSSCILFILSDAFLLKEWNNKEFRQHLRYLITKEKTRFICIQMHDICDEEVEEYFTEKLQIPRFVSLENDEFLFWQKLAYFLYTNETYESRLSRFNFKTKNRVRQATDHRAAIKNRENFSSALAFKHATPDLYSSSASFDLHGLSHRDQDASKFKAHSSRINKKKISRKEESPESPRHSKFHLPKLEDNRSSNIDSFKIRQEILNEDFDNYSGRGQKFDKKIKASPTRSTYYDDRSSDNYYDQALSSSIVQKLKKVNSIEIDYGQRSNKNKKHNDYFREDTYDVRK